MSDKIGKDDLVEAGVLDNLLKPLRDLQALLDESDAKLKQFGSTAKGALSFENEAKALREIPKVMDEVNRKYEEKKAVQGESLKVNSEVIKLQERLNKLHTEEAQEVAKLKAEISAKNREMTAAARANENQTSTYANLVRETRNAKNESKELGAQLRELKITGQENSLAYKDLAAQYQASTDTAARLDKELKDLDKSVGDNFRNVGNYEGALQELNATVARGGLGYRELRKTIKEYQDIAVKSGRTSPVGQQAIKDASKLQDELDTLSAQTKALADDGANLKAALQFGEVVATGYQSVMAAQQLMGVESEKVLEIMAKIQAVQVIINGLNKIRNALDKASILTLKAKNIAMKLQNLLIGKQVVATTSATTATRVLNTAMRALPIFAIIAGLTALVGLFTALSRSAADSKRDIDAARKALEDFDNVNSRGAEERRRDLEIQKLQNTEARKALEERYKKGEITLKQFQQLRKSLRAEELREERKAIKQSIQDSKDRKVLLERERDLAKHGSTEREEAQAAVLEQIKETKRREDELIIFKARVTAESLQMERDIRKENEETAKSKISNIKKEIEKETELSAIRLKTLEKTNLGLHQIQGGSNEAMLKLEESFVRDMNLLELDLLQSGVSKIEFDKQMKDKEIENLRLRIAARRSFNMDVLDLEIELENLLQANLEKSGESIKITANQISAAVVDIYTQATDRALDSLKRLEDGYKRMYGTFEKLAAEGNITAQQSMAEMIEQQEEAQRRQMALERRKLRMQQAQQVSSILLSQLDAGKTPGEALAAAGAFLATSMTLMASLPSFDVGTENTGKNGRGIDGKGGFLAINHPNERILTADQNKKVGGLSNPLLADLAYQYRTGQLKNDNAGNSYDLIVLQKELVGIKQAIQDQPQHFVGLEETLSKVVRLTTSEKKRGHQNINEFRT